MLVRVKEKPRARQRTATLYSEDADILRHINGQGVLECQSSALPIRGLVALTLSHAAELVSVMPVLLCSLFFLSQLLFSRFSFFCGLVFSVV